MYKNLLIEIFKSGKETSRMAKELNMSEKELVKKLTGLKKFRINDALKISKFLNEKCISIEYLFK